MHDHHGEGGQEEAVLDEEGQHGEGGDCEGPGQEGGEAGGQVLAVEQAHGQGGQQDRLLVHLGQEEAGQGSVISWIFESTNRGSITPEILSA